MLRILFTAVSITGLATAQAVLPPFDTAWNIVNLGPTTGIGGYGGTAFLPANPNVLLIGPYGNPNVFAVPLARNGVNQIVGSGPATAVLAVGGNDGGLAHHPTSGVLFGTWYGPNRLWQVKPGSVATDRVDDLANVGIFDSVGTCTFVPPGLPGAGRFKVCTWSAGEFHDLALTPDGLGTYAPGPTSTMVPLPNGPEGIVYVPSSAPLLGGQLLVCEWSLGNIVAYQVNATGDPLPLTRAVVAGGAPGLGGGTIDPLTGDLVFVSAYGELLILRTGTVCGTFANYGVASPGALGTPIIGASGCARIGQTITLSLGGVPNGFGILAAGSYALSVPFANLTVLQPLEATVAVFLGPSGSTTLPLPIPVNPFLGYAHFYLQLAILDASTSSGLIASDGLDVLIR